MNQLTQEIFDQMRNGEEGIPGEFPPPCYLEVGAQIETYIPGTSMIATFPIKKAYNNPFGITNGGFYGVFFDMTFGPFASLEAKAPSLSLDLNITFLKPLSPLDEKVWIEAWIVSHTKSYMIMHGKAMGKSKRLVATATTRLYLSRKKA